MGFDISPEDAAYFQQATLSYKIVRYYRDLSVPNETIMTGLYREQAEDHVNNPEASSATATSSLAKELTALKGEWFEGFTAE